MQFHFYGHTVPAKEWKIKLPYFQDLSIQIIRQLHWSFLQYTHFYQVQELFQLCMFNWFTLVPNMLFCLKTSMKGDQKHCLKEYLLVQPYISKIYSILKSLNKNLIFNVLISQDQLAVTVMPDNLINIKCTNSKHFFTQTDVSWTHYYLWGSNFLCNSYIQVYCEFYMCKRITDFGKTLKSNITKENQFQYSPPKN